MCAKKETIEKVKSKKKKIGRRLKNKNRGI